MAPRAAERGPLAPELTGNRLPVCISFVTLRAMTDPLAAPATKADLLALEKRLRGLMDSKLTNFESDVLTKVKTAIRVETENRNARDSDQ